MALKGKPYLVQKLQTLRARASVRYDYYEMKNSHRTASVAIPWDVAQRYTPRLGWCTKAVDALADRLVVAGLKGDKFGMADIFAANNPDILHDSAILGALITSCDFYYIRKDDSGDVRMQVIDGRNATGILDRTTNLLTEGYAVLERNPETDAVVTDAYFTPDETVITSKGQVWSIPNPIGIPLLVPMIYRPDSRREFGHSRISRSAMRIQDQTEDLLTRINVLSDLASWPQKYVLGLAEETDEMDSLRATVSSLLRFDKDSDGDRPTVGQFSQMSMDGPMREFEAQVSLFSGETGLTRDDLGFAGSNPASAEAIKAAHENLRLTAAKAQRCFSTGIINAGYVGACLRDGIRYSRSLALETSVIWRPIVEPDAAMLSAIGDGVNKINQAVPDFFDRASLEALTGYTGAEVTDAGLFGIADDGQS